MDRDDATQQLEGAELVPLMKGSLAGIKEMLGRCLERDIPAMVGRPPPEECASCGITAQLLVREEDIPRVMALKDEEFLGMVAREGTVGSIRSSDVQPVEGDEPPCPACGTAAPLCDGACSECGLQLG